MRILITGVGGFIGMHVAEALLNSGEDVIGIDILSDTTSKLKIDRVARLSSNPKFYFANQNLVSVELLKRIFEKYKPHTVIHLAAKAGVTEASSDLKAYIDSNLVSFVNIIELSKVHEIEHFVYASSSSVYGLNAYPFFNESHSAERPLSFYAATKKSNELIAHSYSHTYGLQTTGLRFFSVYGPWSGNNSVIFKFTKSILQGEPIRVYGDGKMQRDFTFIDDAVAATISIVVNFFRPSTSCSPGLLDRRSLGAVYKILNIGSSRPIELTNLVHHLENILGIKADVEECPMRPGELMSTAADSSALCEYVDFNQVTPFTLGLRRSVDWYKRYYLLV